MQKIAAIQLTSSSDLNENLDKISNWVKKAAEEAASLVVLPENMLMMGQTETDKLNIAEAFGEGSIQAWLSNLAIQHKIWLVAGTLPLKSPDKNRVTASSLVYNSEGHCVARYDKLHLFDVCVDSDERYEESKTIFPGKEIVCLSSPVGKLGLSVCYDLRFPELYRALFKKGAEIMTVPSAFTEKTGKAHWEVLLRARAIENFSYVIAANQVGQHSNGRKTYGHSMIVDPFGKILAERPDGEGVITAEIDLNYLHRLRENFPVHLHQRINTI